MKHVYKLRSASDAMRMHLFLSQCRQKIRGLHDNVHNTHPALKNHHRVLINDFLLHFVPIVFIPTTSVTCAFTAQSRRIRFLKMSWPIFKGYTIYWKGYDVICRRCPLDSYSFHRHFVVHGGGGLVGSCRGSVYGGTCALSESRSGKDFIYSSFPF